MHRRPCNLQQSNRMCFCRYITGATRLYLYRFLSRRKMDTVSIHSSSLPPLPRALIICAIALRPPGTNITPAPHDLVILSRARYQTDQRWDQWHRRQYCNHIPFHDHSSLGGSAGCWSHFNQQASKSPHTFGYLVGGGQTHLSPKNVANSSSLIERMRSALLIGMYPLHSFKFSSPLRAQSALQYLQLFIHQHLLSSALAFHTIAIPDVHRPMQERKTNFQRYSIL